MAQYKVLKPSRFENGGKVYEVGSIIDDTLLGSMKPGENLELIEEEEDEEEDIVPPPAKPATLNDKLSAKVASKPAPPAKPAVKK